MILVICMAGFNTRFHDAGFDCPKYLLPYRGGTVIGEILKGITDGGALSEIICLANIRDRYFAPQLKTAVEPFGATIHYIRDTKGQAHTAAIGAELATIPGPLLIHNADTVVRGRRLSEIESKLRVSAAYIDVFSGNNPAYCYIDINDGHVEGIVEKKRITPYASSGLYGFSSADEYLELYNETLVGFEGPEIFVSDVLATAIADGTVMANSIDETHQTIVIGSPQEYSAALEAQ